MKRNQILCALLAAFIQPVLAGPANSAASKDVAKLVAAIDIPYTQFTLDNGLRVIVHSDRKAPVVAVSVWYGIGSKHEPKGKTGFAHLFEHLMFNGSENAPGDFFAPLQEVGATDYNGTTNFDRTNYYETVPAGAIDRALFLESDRMGHLLGAVTQQVLDNQRGVVQNEKRQGDNQPYGLTFYEILKGLFPEGHPYHHSIIGSMADLDAASLNDVKQWFRDNYGPNNAVLVIAGDIDETTARNKVQKWFGDIPRGPAVKPVKPEVPGLAAPVSKEMKDRVAAVRLMRLWPIPGALDKDAMALQVAGSVLGGLASSRLDNALVRKEKLAENVVAYAALMQDAGYFYVSMNVLPGVDPGLAGKRLDAVVGEFIEGGPDKDELRRVVTSTLSQSIGGLESVGGNGGKAVTLAEGALFAGDPGLYRKELAELAALTPARVKVVAQNWLKRPAFTLTVKPGERDAYEEAKPVAPPPPAGQGLATGKRGPIPDVAELAGLDFPDIERGTLRNGVPVYLVKRSTVPKVRVTVSFDAGYAADPRDALGTQSLMLNLMNEGTTSRNSTQIAEESERLGAAISIGASLDRTSISLSALKTTIKPSIGLLSDIVRNPAFAPDEVERLKAQQLAGIAAELTRAESLAARVMPVKLFGAAHPYGIPGSGTGDPKVVKMLTRDELAAFHKKWLRPDTMRIMIVGDTDLKTMLPLLERNFGNWKSDGTPKPVKDFTVPIPKAEPRIYLIDRPNSPQSVIRAGMVLNRTGRDDLVALRQANDVLGGSFLSRINMDLRETKSWSYGARSAIGAQEGPVTLAISAPVQADRTGDSIRAIREQIATFLTTKGVTTEERNRTINGAIRELPGSFETSGDVLGGLVQIVNLERPDNYYETLAEKYRGLTADALDATARMEIDPSKLIYVVVGDASKVRPQLDGLGLPVETVTVAPAE